MKIAHVCLSNFYIDGFRYQENQLVRQHIKEDHEVLVIASTETYDASGHLTYVAPTDYLGPDGARVIRIPYRKFLPHGIMKKLRMHPGVYDLLQEFGPDVILFHGMCGWELHTVSRYKRANPTVKLYVDSHEDQNNSARTFLSRHFLHRLYYAWIIQRCYRFFDKVLCISLETIDFVRNTYGVPGQLLEFFPLGGEIFAEDEYLSRRDRGRRTVGLTEGQVMLLQTGKMGRAKKIIESLEAFSSVRGDHLRLVIAGLFDEETRDAALERIARDSRIIYLGWASGERLEDLLCAADVYVQPGTQSATMQMSLCARCPVIIDNVLSHQPYLEGNGWLVSDQRDLEQALNDVADNLSRLGEMSMNSLAIAEKLLDYKALAARILR